MAVATMPGGWSNRSGRRAVGEALIFWVCEEMNKRALGCYCKHLASLLELKPNQQGYQIRATKSPTTWRRSTTGPKTWIHDLRPMHRK